MGHRHNIGKMPKTLHDSIKDSSSLKELREAVGKTWKEPEDEDDDYNYLGCYELTTELFCLGKSIDDSYLEPFRSDVFSSPELTKYYNTERDFYIINREGFKAIIQEFHNIVFEYFRDLEEGREDRDLYFRQKLDAWKKNSFKVNPYF